MGNKTSATVATSKTLYAWSMEFNEFKDCVTVTGYTNVKSTNKSSTPCKVAVVKIDQKTRTVYDVKGVAYELSTERPKLSDSEKDIGTYVNEFAASVKEMGAIVGRVYFDAIRTDDSGNILPSRQDKFEPFYEFMKAELAIVKTQYGA